MLISKFVLNRKFSALKSPTFHILTVSKQFKMNSNQEKISEDLILFLKSKDGMTTSQDIMNNVDGFNNNRFVVIRGLKELKLIDNAGSNSYLLTVKGFNFKSFADLKREKLLKKTKKNISFILNIVFLFVTIILSIQNSNLQEKNLSLSEKNTEIVEKVTKLEGELNRLDVQLNYLLKHQTEISPSDTIK